MPFISFDKSLEILKSQEFGNTQTKKLFLSDALGAILATDIVATTNSPEFQTSAMDGYAFCYDLNISKLKLKSINPAGSDLIDSVNGAEAIKTMTGALIPNGADTIIPIENVTVENNVIRINKSVPKGFAIRDIGENFKKGEILIKKGTKIGFAQIGVMASLNISQVTVYEAPTISILSSGSELIDVGQKQTNKSQIVSSNHLTLEAIAKSHGANTRQLGVISDDKESLSSTIKSALIRSDIVVTTGGVSVGDYDFVKDIIKDELGATVLFQGVKIKPGQHIIVAKKETEFGNKYIVGLPGFAYSSTVTFLIYLLPLLYKFMQVDYELDFISATMESEYQKRDNKTHFVSCNAIKKDGEYFINLDGKKSGSSAILTNMLGSESALLFVEEEKNHIKKGEKVWIIKQN
jgi:molybdopterin molybdotransferase